MLSSAKKLASIILSALLFSTLIFQPVSAFSNTITFDVEYRQTDARSMLSMMNDWRTGGDAWYYDTDSTTKIYTGVLPALTYDYDLEQIAMQRAREIILSWGHDKPDGRSFYSWAGSDGYNGTYTVAENIAGGTVRVDAATAFAGWQETSANYSGQGHRRTMLGKSYTAVGIAHVYYNGRHYWVQEFGKGNSGAAATAAVDSTGVSGTVDYGNSTLTLAIQSQYSFLEHDRSIDYGDYDFLPTCTVVAQVKASTVTGVVLPASNYPGSWASSAPSVVKIDGNKYYGVGVGSSVLSYTAVINGTTVSKSITMTVNKPADFTNAKVTLPDGTGYMYNGDPICPAVTVAIGDTALTEGTDYRVSYSNNVNAGTGTCTITGLGDFEGAVKSVNFLIGRCHIYYPLSESPLPAQEYTGEPVTPSFTLTYNGKTLTEGTDFTVAFSNNTAVGNATAVFTGTGNFNGSTELTFRINARNVSNLTISPIADQTYTGSAVTPAVTVTDGTRVLAEGTDYTVRYTSNTAAGKAAVTITGKGNYRGSATVTFNIVDPKPMSAWDKVDGVWYYYDANGQKVTGWYKLSGTWYYFDPAGAMQRGWQKIEGKWYYFNASGAMSKGWQKIEGKWYYFDPGGVMQTGWKKISGKWYYLKESGAMATGWLLDGGKWYYLDTNGVMLASVTRQIGSKSYTFDASGVCVDPNGT